MLVCSMHTVGAWAQVTGNSPCNKGPRLAWVTRAIVGNRNWPNTVEIGPTQWQMHKDSKIVALENLIMSWPS